MKLLVDGKNAFPEIISCMKSAEKSIYINMFIWRDDVIGNVIAREVLDAADRGVKVTITKDRYGVICECCEESRRSFFHRKTNLSEKIKIGALSCFYNRESLKAESKTNDKDISGGLLTKILNPPNIKAEYSTNRCDHSKFFIFDDSTVIVGGINIEDKENGADLAGRAYHDYMVKITETELVREFIIRRTHPKTDGLFGMNMKLPVRHFGMKGAYLELIEGAEKSLTLVMAYFSPLPEFELALLRAAERLDSLIIVIPQKANFQNDLNRKTVSRLVKRSGGKIKLYYYPGMLHAKLLISEKTISLGSCNITKKAFGQLDELNVFADNDGSDFARQVRENVTETIERSIPADGRPEYDPLIAAFESVLV